RSPRASIPSTVGRMGAIPVLADVVVRGPTTRARLAAVSALAEIATPPAMAAVATALADADREIRLAAARALVERPCRPAVAMIEAYLKGPLLRSADRVERVTAFECYGLHCGDAGVPWLSELLVGKGRFLVRKEPSETRACAALALGRVGTAAAQATLRSVATDADIVVRSAVGRALREGGRRR
ncbi:MAG: HEAT repeat domain-containing protein, partial [Gemmatimonadota bacterium]